MKKVIIIGASSGMGFEVAKLLLAETTLCGAYSSIASLKKILSFERKNKIVPIFFGSLLTYSYLCTVAWSAHSWAAGGFD